MILRCLEKKNCKRKNKTKQREGTQSRNWHGRKRKLASIARRHERQRERDFLERVFRAEYTVSTSFFTWGQERTVSGASIVKAELSHIF